MSAPALPETAQIPHGFGTITLTSDPDGAEIYVDEKFAGNTPAKLKLPAGTHIMVLKSPDHAVWRRTLEVFKDSQVNLKAELDAK
jgi:hypothetical protein